MRNKRAYWVIQTAYWFVSVFHNAIALSYFGVGNRQILVGLSAEIVVLYTGTYLYSLFIYSQNYTIKNWKAVTFIGFTTCFLLVSVVTYLHMVFFPDASIFALTSTSIISFKLIVFLDCLRYIYPWFGAFHGYRLITAAFENIKDKNQVAIALKSAELENLKNQLNPHFLFNSLNSIKALTLSDIKVCREAITELSELLRTSLNFKNVLEIPLSDEIALVERYLLLEKIRFESRLSYSINIQPDTLTIKIPPMAVQLLVENAIKHGINASKKGGFVAISGEICQRFLLLNVTNTGTIIHNERKGVGIDNLIQRLKLNYGNRAELSINQVNEEVLAQIKIPVFLD